MLRAVFYRRDNALCGFDVTGHAGYGTQGSDVVCAAVSSAVMLVCNAVTDFMGAGAHAEVGENIVSLRVQKHSAQSESLLEAFYDHMQGIAAEYSKVKVETRNTGG